MSYDPYALKIYIDGSAYKNPGGEGGIAAIVEFPDDTNREPDLIFTKGFSETTNQRMELRACIEALKWARENARLFGCPRVVIITDSQYVVDNHRNALYWKRNKWRNKDGRPIENPDLWGKLLAERPKIGVRTDIEWGKGKSTEIGKLVDKAAKKSAKGFDKIRDRGFESGKISRTKLPGEVATLYPACGQVETIRIYRKDLIYRSKRVEYKILFEVLSEKDGTYTSKNFAYTSPENESQLHRGHAYRVEFNCTPKYPIILVVLDEVH